MTAFHTPGIFAHPVDKNILIKNMDFGSYSRDINQKRLSMSWNMKISMEEAVLYSD